MSKSGKKKLLLYQRITELQNAVCVVFCLSVMRWISTSDQIQHAECFLQLIQKIQRKHHETAYQKRKTRPRYSPCFNPVNVKAELKNASNTSELLIQDITFLNQCVKKVNTSSFFSLLHLTRIMFFFFPLKKKS